MNAARRKTLNDAVATLITVRELIESVRDEEQEAFDNLPESMQQGEKGEKMESAISGLEDADTAIEEAMGAIESATQ